jgi:hypothetical protein
MINIPVDEGYGYDVLAIAQVKNNMNIKNSKIYFEVLDDSISNQVGKILHNDILNSKEYQELIEANKETFDAVEKARYSSITAKEVDMCNLKRYQCKINLQNKFFPNNLILENKS